jgi:pimeloyl-ACP methyl ester carboxylesterase
MYQDSLTQAAEQGAILFFHGLSVSKEIQVKELTSLAEHGFLAIGLDNVGHGARRYADFDRRFSDNNPDLGANFLQAVLQTAQEVPLIIDALAAEKLTRPNKIGVAGISMGGYITYTAITLEPRLTVAASILGSPEWQHDLPESPHHHRNKFNHIKLISQNASLDVNVPAKYARRFHRKLESAFDDYQQRFAYFEYPNSNHFMTESDWAVCWDRTVRWFKHHFAHPNQKIKW